MCYRWNGNDRKGCKGCKVGVVKQFLKGFSYTQGKIVKREKNEVADFLPFQGFLYKLRIGGQEITLQPQLYNLCLIECLRQILK